MKIIASNKFAHLQYQLTDKLEAGIQLFGYEVKSIRNSQVSLKESFVKIKEDNSAWLMNCHIAPYPSGTPEGYNPIHPRKLLMHKKEIKQLKHKLDEKGMAVVPLNIYIKNNLIKIELGLGKGRKAHDKRAVIKKRETDRIAHRAIKRTGKV